MNKPEFSDGVLDRIRAHLMMSIETWLPSAERTVGGGYKACNPIRGDKNPESMHIYPDGRAYDFASGEALDTIDLWAAVNGLSLAEAIRHHGARLGLNSSSHAAKVLPIRSLPKDKTGSRPSFEIENLRHPNHGKPKFIYIYKNIRGELLGYTCRFESGDGRKKVLPYTYSFEKKCWGWSGEGWGEVTPIYGAEHLTANPSQKVLIVEGEKPRDAAAKLLNDFVVISWLGGTGKAGKVDWTALKHRDVTIWPDADLKKSPLTGEILQASEQPGMKAALVIARNLQKLGVMAKIVEPPEGVPDGWDLADAEDSGWTKERVLEQLNEKVRLLNDIEGGESIEALNIVKISPNGQVWKANDIAADIRLEFENAIKAGSLAEDFPFAINLHCYRPKSDTAAGRRTPYFVAKISENGLVSIVDEMVFIDSFVFWYDHEGSLRYGGVNMPEILIVTLAKRLAQRLSPLPNNVSLFKWSKAPGLAWNNLNFTISGECIDSTEVTFDCSEESALAVLEKIAPPWFEQLSRMNNRLGFMAFMGAIIDPSANPQQYLWLYGAGNDGKSTVLSVLQSLFGSAALTTDWPDNPNNFFTSRMEGKRLMLLDDQEHDRIVRSGLFKTVTGSKSILIEHKGQAPYLIDNRILVVAASNHRPRIKAESHDTRRLVLCEIKSHSDSIANYEAQLLLYGDQFFSVCWRLWQAHKGNRNLVPVDKSVIDENLKEVYSEAQDFLAEHFEFFDETKIKARLSGGGLKRKVQHVTNSELRSVCIKERISYGEVRDYCINVLRFPCDRVSVSKNDKQRVIFGITPKARTRLRFGLEERDYDIS